ncbi:MAG: hypothetical protein ABEJ07_05040 [Candidatus Nanohaloarchaea archaeon]
MFLGADQGLERAVYALDSRGQRVSLGVIAAEKHSAGRPCEVREAVGEVYPVDMDVHIDMAYGMVSGYGPGDIEKVEETFL